jgi:hypothetical protein
VTASEAILLAASDLLRFVPNANFEGAETLTAHAWSVSSGRDGTPVNLALKGSTGGTTAFSAAKLVATCLVSSAPTLN